jgi:hypothetical protein
MAPLALDVALVAGGWDAASCLLYTGPVTGRRGKQRPANAPVFVMF